MRAADCILPESLKCLLRIFSRTISAALSLADELGALDHGFRLQFALQQLYIAGLGVVVQECADAEYVLSDGLSCLNER